MLAASDSPTDSIESMQPLASRRGEEAMALFRDEAALSRMTSLINSYSLDLGSEVLENSAASVALSPSSGWTSNQPSSWLTDTPVGLCDPQFDHGHFGQELVDDQDQQIRAAHLTLRNR